MANPCCPKCGSYSHLWDIEQVAQHTSRYHILRTYICSNCRNYHHAKEFISGETMSKKPDTISSKEWTRQQPMKWRMKIARLCHLSQITVEHLDDNVEVWEAMKDAGQCRLVYKGDYVDGVGAFNGGYYIEYGGLANDPAFVSGETVIQIEWLS